MDSRTLISETEIPASGIHIPVIRSLKTSRPMKHVEQEISIQNNSTEDEICTLEVRDSEFDTNSTGQHRTRMARHCAPYSHGLSRSLKISSSSSRTAESFLHPKSICSVFLSVIVWYVQVFCSYIIHAHRYNRKVYIFEIGPRADPDLVISEIFSRGFNLNLGHMPYSCSYLLAHPLIYSRLDFTFRNDY